MNSGLPELTPPADPSIRYAVTPWHQKNMVRVLLIVLAVLTIGAGAAYMLFFIGGAVGPGLLLLSALMAAIPLPVMLLAFLWLDRYEPEPWHYLAFAFGWGAFAATAIALNLNKYGAEFYEADSQESPSMWKVAVFVAPPVEEIAKAIPLFLILGLTMLGRRTINGIIDGVVYAGCSAIGFAFTENILYFGGAYLQGEDVGAGGGAGALIVTFFVRAILTPFAHPLFTVLTGIGVGLAVRYRYPAIRALAPIAGLVLAICLHGTWNLIASSHDLKVMGIGYTLIMLPLLIVIVGLAIWLRSHEGKVTVRMLPPYVAAGWLTNAELAFLTTMHERRAARQWASTYGGSTGSKAMQEFQLAATRLAILRDDIERGHPRKDFAATEQELLQIMTTRRQVIVSYAAMWTHAWRNHPQHPQAAYSYGYGSGR